MAAYTRPPFTPTIPNDGALGRLLEHWGYDTSYPSGDAAGFFGAATRAFVTTSAGLRLFPTTSELRTFFTIGGALSTFSTGIGGSSAALAMFGALFARGNIANAGTTLPTTEPIANTTPNTQERRKSRAM
ncbi:MAG: hypothetical protein E6G04_08870 [Actinobacteria bacterium]|nr:MAG: hypothetical protein E6G04_08870 [Actinomycetota bacterium]